MTPSQKLDTILRAGDIPQIHEVMDCDQYPYVCMEFLVIATPYGTVKLHRGRFYDGSSGPKIMIPFIGVMVDLAKDLFPQAFAAHDDLFRHPYVYRNGTKERVGFVTCNRIYGYIIRKHGKGLLSYVRRTMLFACGWVFWRRYRKAEAAGTLCQQDFYVPKEWCWDFPTWQLRDARWRGPRKEDRNV
jgi:hypothetical protein